MGEWSYLLNNGPRLVVEQLNSRWKILLAIYQQKICSWINLFQSSILKQHYVGNALVSWYPAINQIQSKCLFKIFRSVLFKLFHKLRILLTHQTEYLSKFRGRNWRVLANCDYFLVISIHVLSSKIRHIPIFKINSR